MKVREAARVLQWVLVLRQLDHDAIQGGTAELRLLSD